jgi:hypothetical protein
MDGTRPLGRSHIPDHPSLWCLVGGRYGGGKVVVQGDSGKVDVPIEVGAEDEPVWIWCG